MQSNSPASLPHGPWPAAVLPHRNPFLFIDRVTAVTPGVSAAGITCVTSEQSFFPHLLLVEAMAQLAGIAAAEREGEGGFLAAIASAQVVRPVQPGDCLQVTVTIVKSFGRLFLVEGCVCVADEQVATACFTLGVGSL
jgi:3-hydroxyacyl-[acyl-carrier-protein] dehydratase